MTQGDSAWQLGDSACATVDAVMRQQPKNPKAAKKQDAMAQWTQVRRPSAYGQNQGQMYRCSARKFIVAGACNSPHDAWILASIALKADMLDDLAELVSGPAVHFNQVCLPS